MRFQDCTVDHDFPKFGRNFLMLRHRVNSKAISIVPRKHDCRWVILSWFARAIRRPDPWPKECTVIARDTNFQSCEIFGLPKTVWRCFVTPVQVCSCLRLMHTIHKQSISYEYLWVKGAMESFQFFTNGNASDLLVALEQNYPIYIEPSPFKK